MFTFYSIPWKLRANFEFVVYYTYCRHNIIHHLCRLISINLVLPFVYTLSVNITRYTPSQADVQVFEQVGKAPAASLPHALRWFNQIASYGPAERKVWPAGASPLTAGGKTTTAPAAKDDDDDDVDLFGSGDEEEVSHTLLIFMFWQIAILSADIS